MGKGIDTNINFIRIDPYGQTIARLRQKFGASNERVIRDIRKIVRSEQIDLRQLQVIEEKRLIKAGFDVVTRQPTSTDEGGTPLLVAAGVLHADNVAGWRLLGCEDTMGIGILFGQGIGGGMVDCPVDLEWVRKRIRWVPGETDQQVHDRAVGFVDRHGEDLGGKLAEALLRVEDHGPFEPGDSVYRLAAGDEHLAAALRTEGITDEQSGGRRLTRFGAAVRDVFLAQEDARG